MKRIGSVISLLLAGVTVAGYCQDELSWHQQDSTHFIAYYTECDSSTLQPGDSQSDFIEKVLSEAEESYRNVSGYFGYEKRSSFWTWDRKVAIYIYPDRESYQKHTDTPEWSLGVANYKKRTISSFSGCQDFLGGILPHEITHLVFREFVGLNKSIPLWLDEGLAQWSEIARRKERYSQIKDHVMRGSVMPLSSFATVDISLVRDTEDSIYIRQAIQEDGAEGAPLPIFLTGRGFVQLYYLQASSTIGFMLERYGTLKFAAFCRQLRDGAELDYALSSAYAPSITTVDDLEEEWLASFLPE